MEISISLFFILISILTSFPVFDSRKLNEYAALSNKRIQEKLNSINTQQYTDIDVLIDHFTELLIFIDKDADLSDLIERYLKVLTKISIINMTLRQTKEKETLNENPKIANIKITRTTLIDFFYQVYKEKNINSPFYIFNQNEQLDNIKTREYFNNYQYYYHEKFKNPKNQATDKFLTQYAMNIPSFSKQMAQFFMGF